ncbi:hypothetical protein TNCV_1880311 [Trichonephila clavipes]|nr:hypothetical protein TNCV_1880311 [Trichonephila clavipes]
MWKFGKGVISSEHPPSNDLDLLLALITVARRRSIDSTSFWKRSMGLTCQILPKAVKFSKVRWCCVMVFHAFFQNIPKMANRVYVWASRWPIYDKKSHRNVHSTIQYPTGTSEYFRTNFEEEIPTLYRKDIDEVELPMDKTSSHTFESTAAYLAKKESET